MPALPSGVRGAVITGWGTALPDKIVTNDDLEQMVDTTDEWIVERTGIRERHVGGTTVGAVDRGRPRQALDMSGVDLGRDRRVWCSPRPPPTSTVPATAPTVQHELGLRCGAFDVNAACSGFVYGARRRPRPDRHGRAARCC